MKKNYLIVLLGILLFSFNFCFNSKVGYSIKGRWYFVENTIYKEIHANDTVFCLFDWKNDAGKSLFLYYYIKKDTLWSLSKIPDPIIQLDSYYWGTIVKHTKDSILLKKGSSKIVFYKIDEVDSLFTKKLSQNLYVNYKLDTFRFNQWMNYEEEYDKRVIKYYKEHPEFTNRGNKDSK